MSAIVIDLCFVLVILLSLVIGAYRGFVRSLLSVASWILAAWATWKYAGSVAPYFETLSLDPTLQLIAANIAVFFVVLALCAIVSIFFARAIVLDSMIGADRTLGVAFGLLRGCVIVVLIALISSFTFAIEEPWWQESYVLPILEPYVFEIRETIADYFAPPTFVG